MAKKKFHTKKKMTIPLAIVAGFAAPASVVWPIARTGDIGGAIKATGKIMTGWDSDNNRWDMNLFKRGALPVAIGFGIHKLAGKFGVNRALASTGLPFRI